MAQSTIQKKILLIRFSSLGDVALTIPVLDECLIRYGKNSVVYLTKRLFSPPVAYHPAVASLIFLDDFPKLGLLRKRIKEERFDMILDLHTSLRSFRLTFGMRSVKRYKKQRFQRFLLTQFKFHLGQFRHVSEKYLRALGGKYSEHNPKLFLPPEKLIQEKNKKDYDVLKQSSSVLGIAVGASKTTKMYPIDKMAHVIRGLEKDFDRIVFFGQGEEEEKLTQELIQTMDKKYINLVSKLSISELLLFTRELNVFLGNDSGPAHIAALNSVSVFAIFGQTVQDYGFTPLGWTQIIETMEKLSCRPCGHLGRDTCPQKHFDCMNTISPQSIIQQIREKR